MNEYLCPFDFLQGESLWREICLKSIRKCKYHDPQMFHDLQMCFAIHKKKILFVICNIILQYVWQEDLLANQPFHCPKIYIKIFTNKVLSAIYTSTSLLGYSTAAACGAR